MSFVIHRFITHLETNIDPENRPAQKRKCHLPTINFVEAKLLLVSVRASDLQRVINHRSGFESPGWVFPSILEHFFQ